MKYKYNYIPSYYCNEADKKTIDAFISTKLNEILNTITDENTREKILRNIL